MALYRSYFYIIVGYMKEILMCVVFLL